ncbi:MAG: BPSL0067 family protein [Pyrinomonadaceae bacterium]
MKANYGGSYDVSDDFGRPAKEWRFDEPNRVIKEFPGGVGNRQCVALVQTLLDMPSTKRWFEDTNGTSVYGNHALPQGTVIATFVGGKYLSMPNGNHAAIYIKQIPKGILVIDQWIHEGKVKPPSFREIHDDPKATRSNYAPAFSAVRTSSLTRR